MDKLFVSLLEEGDGVANRILLGMNIDIDLLYEKFSNRIVYHSGKKGRNLLLEEYAIDLNKKYEEEYIIAIHDVGVGPERKCRGRRRL